MSVRSMEPSGAQVLDRLLRAKARSVVASMERFKDLLRQAAEGQIHVALGFASWPAYIADVVSARRWAR